MTGSDDASAGDPVVLAALLDAERDRHHRERRRLLALIHEIRQQRNDALDAAADLRAELELRSERPPLAG